MKTYLITDQQNRHPFNRLTWTIQKLLLLEKKNQVFILHDLGSLLFQAPGSICELTILGTWHRIMRAKSSLFLLVWTPKLKAKLPMLTWISQTSSVHVEITDHFPLNLEGLSLKSGMKKIMMNPFSHKTSRPTSSKRKAKPSEFWLHVNDKALSALWGQHVCHFKWHLQPLPVVLWLQNSSALLILSFSHRAFFFSRLNGSCLVITSSLPHVAQRGCQREKHQHKEILTRKTAWWHDGDIHVGQLDQFFCFQSVPLLTFSHSS